MTNRRRNREIGAAGDPAAVPGGGTAVPAGDDAVRALERAADPSLGDRAARQLDEEVVATLAASQRVEAALQEIPLDALASLCDRFARRLAGDGETPDLEQRKPAWNLLDLVRRPVVLRRIPRDEVHAWADRILRLVERSRYTTGPLFRQRAEAYGSKVLFRTGAAGRRGLWTWRRVASRIEYLSRALLSLDRSERPAPVAILCENRIEMALLDLACLTAGIVNVMVPANATESDVGYILGHARAGTVVVSGPHQWAKVKKHRDTLPNLGTAIMLDPRGTREPGVLTLDALARQAEKVPAGEPRKRSERVHPDELATVMYTSGTTGTPKGIQFSHRNIVFKRFARALALPEIGEDDVFLCFLPLFHTFGRYLEMMGCVFWGATYCFLPSTSPEELVRSMQRFRPTVFISVPKKWMQLHERITREADPVTASDEELHEVTHRITGGRLRWGLSAAGHLDSDVFRHFQRQGIELMSGFGMTEATGGITMTPPGEYEDGSLGVPLPGIEASLADDGELRVRGPYVMIGYLDPPDGEPSFDAEGWFHTGDLMEILENGQLRLVDRKKEIYKNTKGETIAPQRVENMFREFESVGRAFLVGDHRDYNTLLVYPNPEHGELDLSSLDEGELRNHFRSLVVSVNQFLAPYERIVDFAIIPRDLQEERGELTPKGTPRRKIVEQSFSDVLRELYRRTSVRTDGVEVLLPNWLFQVLGVTAQDIRCSEAAIVIPDRGTRLTVERQAEDRVRVGSCIYRVSRGPLDLGRFLTSPDLWLGNEELVDLVELDEVTRRRSTRRREGHAWLSRVAPYRPAARDHKVLEACLARQEHDLLEVDLAARMLGSADEADALLGIRVLEDVLEHDAGTLAAPARRLLLRVAGDGRPGVRRRAFRVLVPAGREDRFADVLRRFTEQDPDLFDAETCRALSDQTISAQKLERIIDRTLEACSGELPGEHGSRLARGLLDFLAAYGAVHPTAYRRIRAVLERMSLLAEREEVRRQAHLAGGGLLEGFRNWLGTGASIAVDPDTGREYRWDDVVVFEEGVPEADRRRLLSAMRRTGLIAEAVFLFSPGVSIRLSDVVADGIRVRLLGSLHGKSVYRVTVQTRFQGAFDLAVNVNHSQRPEQIRDEIHWLIVSGDPGYGREPLVEDFGGYWPEHDLWSEEFIEGEPLHRAMSRLSGQLGGEQRLQRLWPFMAWATLSAYVDFWNRSGRRLEVADPTMANIIVPTVDFISGVRIVSVSRRRSHEGLPAMLRTFRDEFVAQAERQYPALAGIVGWPIIFSSVLEVVGEQEGLALLGRALDQSASGNGEVFDVALRAFVQTVAADGFTPLRLYLATERYLRWARLSTDATSQARARTVRELYDTYGLGRLEAAYPEIRVRFFRDTVFRDCAEPLDRGLGRIIGSIRNGELSVDDLIDAVDELRADQDLGPDDEYFLARLSFPHLRPQDEADFVRRDQGGRRQSDIVVTLEDADGQLLRLRHALNPKEVERLLRLFLAAKLDVHFRMEHRYLVAINERSHIVGGIYYEIDDEGQTAHFEKIVVAERYRGRRVARGLMQELFNRLRSAGIKTLTTGFFRAEYFYTYGFRVEKQFAGLVKDLDEPDPTPETPK